MEPRSHHGGGRRETEEPGKDSSAEEVGAPLTWGRLGGQRSQGRDQGPQCRRERKEEAALGIFRLGNRCFWGERSVKKDVSAIREKQQPDVWGGLPCPDLPLGTSCWKRDFQGPQLRGPFPGSFKVGRPGGQSLSAPRAGLLKGALEEYQSQALLRRLWNAPLECSQPPTPQWVPAALATTALQEPGPRQPRA